METNDAAPVADVPGNGQHATAMKLAYVVCDDVLVPAVMEMLDRSDIDYYTRWERTKGKGRGTAPHLGTRGGWSTNSVFMLAFVDCAPLDRLVADIRAFNAAQSHLDHQIRLFQVALERVV